ncbi:magnesium and cobalt transport protein CorA [Rhodococcus triatomae]|uniref:Magnesium transporter n=1 Tax=Rhodococcus triatomae TaxID=300028 RepID=A0A1G8KEH3_9NOCA|nr:magnesium and cobalt transport protein CorA [Rhodococcus triatomae]QNG25186.1 magnesium and cobalt transport protein CorA [Rhodococcus triatomae]SDI41816.1 magnesium transporter [Rhodococcus triatomae]
MARGPRDVSDLFRDKVFRRRADGAETPAPGSTRRTRYVEGGRLSPTPIDATVAETLRFAGDRSDRTALLLYPTPSHTDVEELAEAWRLHPVLTEDLLHAGQRPKIERYGDVLFLVVRSAWYVDETEDVDFAEFHVLVRPHAVAVLCQDGRWIDGTDARAFTPDESGPDESDPEDSSGVDRGDHTLLDDARLLELGPEAVVYRLLDAIVDGYRPVLRGLEIDKEQIERQVFRGEAAVAERIYRLSEEVIDLRQATTSLTDVLQALRRGFDRYDIPEPLQTYLQDVADHLTRVNAQVTELRDSLSQILAVNATLVAQRQNEDMKKISGWAAILFAPTLVGAVYGMNFDNMPELHWAFGYPMAVGAMAGLALGLYVVFKHNKWM